LQLGILNRKYIAKVVHVICATETQAAFHWNFTI